MSLIRRSHGDALALVTTLIVCPPPYEVRAATWPVVWVSLYTILLLPILYGVWHTKERSRGGRILPNSRAIVLQTCRQCFRRAERMKRTMDPCTNDYRRSRRISCKGQSVSVSRATTNKGSAPYVLNRYSHIPGTQPQEYEYHIPPGYPCT